MDVIWAMQNLPLTCLECDVGAMGEFCLCGWEKVRNEQGTEGSCAGHSPCLVQVISLDWGASSCPGIKGCFPFQFSLKSVSFFLANHNTLLVISKMFFWVNAHSRFLLNSHIFTLLASWAPQILFILVNCEYGKLLLNNALYEQEIIMFIYVVQAQLSHHIKSEKSSI